MHHPPLERFALSKMFRQSCPGCGSRLLRWCLVSEVTSQLALKLAGFPGQLEDDHEVWSCVICGDFGVFGAPEFG